MFEGCTTLLALNAARIKECAVPDADITSINNAYNEQRTKVLQNSAAASKKIQFRQIVVEKGTKYCALPIAGVSDKLGVLQLKTDGFYL